MNQISQSAICYVHVHTHVSSSSLSDITIFAGRVIEDSEEKQAILLKNYLEHVHNKFNKYAFCFFFCELLNICISISQVTTHYKYFCATDQIFLAWLVIIFSLYFRFLKASLFKCKLWTRQKFEAKNGKCQR